ncbi:hypothetical protein COEREDRAFT_92139 [Coemansia reversa NRRL 1564]|uniref:Uncharacterized protein n=1 Tax=Coemansia reversa (strain ATCC 12441 / NRRL 1564) TaxID=763665 RepID=A0A2G5BDI2_COERN|nr:hypothetical protein COEREDRAFT_92139 [Coemansia reversa NRRL 1564]|eukprot:PIA17074.1 hypothetical protein COEREDRAFT_92139 [Coemansia reversa NRRL 1564]
MTDTASVVYPLVGAAVILGIFYYTIWKYRKSKDNKQQQSTPNRLQETGHTTYNNHTSEDTVVHPAPRTSIDETLPVYTPSSAAAGIGNRVDTTVTLPAYSPPAEPLPLLTQQQRQSSQQQLAGGQNILQMPPPYTRADTSCVISIPQEAAIR